jgi:hypothetical protein
LPDISSIVPVLRPITQFLLLAIRIPINEPLTPTTIQPEFSPSSFSPQLNYILYSVATLFPHQTPSRSSVRLLSASSPNLQSLRALLLVPPILFREDKSISPIVLLELKLSGSKNITVVQ